MVKRKATRAPGVEEAETSQRSEMSSVMYIGHIPHGFYEKQMRGFFSQFGTVERLRLSRNKKTGRSKHYAFVEFQSPEIAAIAAEAMNGYMLFTQKLVCEVMPKSQVHEALFKGAERTFRVIPWADVEAERHNRERSPEQQEKRLQRAIKRDQERQERIAAAGLDYKYPRLGAVAAEQTSKKQAKAGKAKSKTDESGTLRKALRKAKKTKLAAA